jgi:hypothetical protein
VAVKKETREGFRELWGVSRTGGFIITITLKQDSGAKVGKIAAFHLSRGGFRVKLIRERGQPIFLTSLRGLGE